MCYQSDLEGLQPKIRAFVFSRITNKCDAFDVVQDINRVIIEKEEDFDDQVSCSLDNPDDCEMCGS